MLDPGNLTKLVALRLNILESLQALAPYSHFPYKACSCACFVLLRKRYLLNPTAKGVCRACLC